MKRIFILTGLLIMSFFVMEAQDTTTAKKWKGKHFEFTALKGYVAASPLFMKTPDQQSDKIYAEVDFGERNWTGFTTLFIEQVLKKYLTIDEIRQLMDRKTGLVMAKVYFDFNYTGDILYAMFIFKDEVKHIFSEDKIYGIYQDFLKLKVDVDGFLWQTANGRLTLEEQNKVYGVANLPFFFKRNCP